MPGWWTFRRRTLHIQFMVFGALVSWEPGATADVRELASRWVEACQRRDQSALRSLFLAQGTYEDPTTRQPVLGALHPGPWADLWHAAAVWRFASIRFVPLVDGGAVEWSAYARIKEKELEFHGMALFGARDGKIAWMRNYFDTRPFLKLLPPARKQGSTQ